MPRLPLAVLVLDMKLSTDQASEASFLESYLQVLEVPTEVVTVRTKKELIRQLTRPKVSHVHISSHGLRSPKGTALALSDTVDVTIEDLALLKGLLQGRTVVSTACFAGSKDLGTQMLTTGCRAYVAPRRVIPWADAAVFSALLYRSLFHSGASLDKAFLLAKEHSQSKGDWVHYPAPA